MEADLHEMVDAAIWWRNMIAKHISCLFCIFPVILLTVFSGCSFMEQPYESETAAPIKVLIFSDRVHIAQKVAAYLEEPDFEITDTADIWMLNSLQGFDVVILIPLEPMFFPEDIVLSIKNFVHAGGGIIGFHDVLSTPLSTVFGGSAGVSPLENLVPEFNISVYNPGHPIVQGIPQQFTLMYEERFLSRCNPKAHGLFNVSYQTVGGKTQTYRAGWAYSFGEGRSFAFTLAHREDTRYNPHILRMMRNAVIWTARRGNE